MASDPEMLKWARILSLVGGIVMIAGSLLFAIVGAFITSFGRLFGDVGWMFGGVIGGLLVIYALFGAALGGLVVYGSTRFETPDARTWSIVVLVCGIVAFFTGAGMWIGPALAAVGGGLALAQQ